MGAEAINGGVVVCASSKKNIPKKEHPHRDLSTALRFGRDDKGEDGASSGIFSCRGVMGLEPAQVMKRAFVQQPLSPEAPSSPLSSRPKRSAVERSLRGCSFLEMFLLERANAGTDL
jgi:hypothetical protein